MCTKLSTTGKTVYMAYSPLRLAGPIRHCLVANVGKQRGITAPHALFNHTGPYYLSTSYRTAGTKQLTESRKAS
jgi:hypothetical protein